MPQSSLQRCYLNIFQSLQMQIMAFLLHFFHYGPIEDFDVSVHNFRLQKLQLLYSLITMKINPLTILITLIGYQLINSCAIDPNSQEIIDASPMLLNAVKNGEKFVLGDLEDPEKNYVYIANLKGSPYEMGVAYGQLFSQQIKSQIQQFYPHYLPFIEELLLPRYLPKFITTHQKDKYIMFLVDLDIYITKRYTNPRILQEINGIAQGSNTSVQDIARLGIFPQVVKAACSIVGLWGSATLDMNTLHLRALDWDSNGPMNKFPLITIYHPSDKKLNPHANLGWVGFVGSLTGISQKVSLGQKVWATLPGKNQPVKYTRYGNPWTYVFRDILYEANSLVSALQMLQKADRTCAIFMGVGSPVEHSFRLIEYSAKSVKIYNDKNYTQNDQFHPKIDGAAWVDRKLQPSHDNCLGSIIQNADYYGKWGIHEMWRVLGKSHKTGDTQLVAFNLETQEALVSYSLPQNLSPSNKTIEAYLRRPIYINFNQFWNYFSE